MKNRKNNKGFSLVELIVVVAIMAVLVGVLAPAYLKYVEKSRVQKDVSAVSEVMAACEVALADETINKNTTSATISFAPTATFTKAAADADASARTLENELADTLGTSVTLTSNGLKTAGVTVTVTVDQTSGAITITAAAGEGASATAAAAITALNN